MLPSGLIRTFSGLSPMKGMWVTDNMIQKMRRPPMNVCCY